MTPEYYDLSFEARDLPEDVMEEVLDDAVPFEICEFCNGSGVDPDDTEETCPECDGSGFEEDK